MVVEVDHKYRGLVFDDFDDLVTKLKADSETRELMVRPILADDDLSGKLSIPQRVTPELAEEYLRKIERNMGASEFVDLYGSVQARFVEGGDKVVLRYHTSPDSVEYFERRLQDTFGRASIYVGSHISIPQSEVEKFLEISDLPNDCIRGDIRKATEYFEREYTFEYCQDNLKVVVSYDPEANTSETSVTFLIQPDTLDEFQVYDARANLIARKFANDVTKRLSR
jgi:hypothetical protein